MSNHEKTDTDAEPGVRRHVYDGIKEYDNKMPNWWLMTLYVTIAFSVGYWFYYAQSGVPDSDGLRVEQEMARIEATKLANSTTLDDESMWKLSQNAVFISAGKLTYETTCASCHGGSMKGGIGPNLIDGEWVHGGKPMDIYKSVSEGILVKGMPAWGPVLGSKKVSEVVAYVLSQQEVK
jgi:cytochrome c oxidase cbb3-type subunit III